MPKASSRNNPKPNQASGFIMKFIELFAGIGGFRLGLEALGHECVFASEIDKYARQTYEANFGEKPHGDITKIDAKDIPDHDIMTAGFPCQDFSQAGPRKGLKGERGKLFYEIVRILQCKRPKYFILENVRGILSIDDRKVFQEICHALTDCGYQIDYKVLNSLNHGVAQKRFRVYIVGKRDANIFWHHQWPVKDGISRCVADIMHEYRGEPVDKKYFISKKYLDGIKKRHAEGKVAGQLLDVSKPSNTISTSERGKAFNLIKVDNLNKGGQGNRVYSPKSPNLSLIHI